MAATRPDIVYQIMELDRITVARAGQRVGTARCGVLWNGSSRVCLPPWTTAPGP